MRHYREYGDTDNWRGLPERHFLLKVLLLFESNSHSLGTMLDKKFRHVPPCCPERRMIFQFIPFYTEVGSLVCHQKFSVLYRAPTVAPPFFKNH